uniref:Uncharacterized protein n=1 Tax=Ixodes ricinus TaxID=34613 RepID=A0A147BNP8_IXORI
MNALAKFGSKLLCEPRCLPFLLLLFSIRDTLLLLIRKREFTLIFPMNMHIQKSLQYPFFCDMYVTPFPFGATQFLFCSYFCGYWGITIQGV